MVTRDCWDEVGEWDASFFLYSEETEYMQRAGDHGWTVWFEPAAVCRHRGGASGSSDQLWALLIENKVRLYRRSHGTTSTAAFRAALLLGECVRAACGSGRSRVAARSLLGRLGPQGSLPSLR
jgi:GT2 family glycosyltransferase